jgi:superoxide dismutase
MFLSLKFFQRDAKIEALQTMLEKQHSEKEKQLVDSLNNIINSHHQETTDKLEKLKETALHQADNQQQLLDHHRQQREHILGFLSISLKTASNHGKNLYFQF